MEHPAIGIDIHDNKRVDWLKDPKLIPEYEFHF